MSELGRRVAVAVVGIPAVLGVAWVGGWVLGVLIAAFAAWGTHELARFAARKETRPIEWIAAPTAAALVLLATARPTFAAFAPWALALLGGSTLLALLVALRARGPTGAPLASVAVTLFGAVYIGLALACVPLLHALPAALGWESAVGGAAASGLAAVTLPLAITWLGDASAFFAGSAWGRAKLAPSISPNKSWVGFWGNVVAGAVAAAVWWVVVGGFGTVTGGAGIATVALLGGVIGVAAVVGDLAESLFKREAGVKDSGTVFPGHGGVLDRIDSLLFTIPAAYVTLLLLAGLA